MQVEEVERANESKLWELQSVISKLPLNVCTTVVLPEFGVRWKEVCRAVRSCRLPLEPGSIARVLRRHAARALPARDLHRVLDTLRLHLVARQSRTWHVVHLEDPLEQEEVPVQDLPHTLARRMQRALREYKPNLNAEVRGISVEGVVYLCCEAGGRALYVAAPPRRPLALLSAAAPDKLLRACAQGLGYGSFTRASLQGAHIPSLLQVAEGSWGGPAGLLPAPRYAPPLAPAQYTTQQYDLQYVDNILGPNPPLLTTLTIKTSGSFFDRSLLNKPINLTLNLKSDNVAQSLRTWVEKGAIAANSELLNVFHKMKSNKVTLVKDDDDNGYNSD